jgi:hypothetical protein
MAFQKSFQIDSFVKDIPKIFGKCWRADSFQVIFEKGNKGNCWIEKYPIVTVWILIAFYSIITIR